VKDPRRETWRVIILELAQLLSVEKSIYRYTFYTYIFREHILYLESHHFAVGAAPGEPPRGALPRLTPLAASSDGFSLVSSDSLV
jgi:hypothetical protein